MPRKPRLEIGGVLQHVMARSVGGHELFRTALDRDELLSRLDSVAQSSGLTVFAWSIQKNHFHLLLKTKDQPISTVMRSLLTGYTKSFNQRHKRSGQLFHNRYKSVLVEEKRYLLPLARYIHLNPLRAGLVKSVEELDSWPWSGHATLMGESGFSWQDTDTVLSQFGKRADTKRRRYRAYLIEGISEGERPDLVGGGLLRSIGGRNALSKLKKRGKSRPSDTRILGSGQFVSRLLNKIEQQKKAKRIRPKEQQRRYKRLTKNVIKRFGLTLADLEGGSRQRTIAKARYIIGYCAVKELGLTRTYVARSFNVSVQSVLRGVEMGKDILEELGWNVKDIL